MMRVDPDAVARLLQEVADEHILPHFGALKAGDIAFKTGDDPVTIADKNAESALSARLLDLLPGSNVVGEEAFAANQGVLTHFSGESPVWVIDPVDGTRNFVKSSSDFGVIVALVKQDQAVAGWIYHPTSREFVTVERGAGAYYQGRRLAVARSPSFGAMYGFLGDRLLATYRKSADGTPEPSFAEMTAGAVEYPRLLLDQPHFGHNRPQAHFRASLLHTTPWDDAVGVLMYEESGGFASFWDGEAYRPSALHKGLALAPDPDSWRQLKTWCATFAALPG